jgi:hypothetical protein
MLALAFRPVEASPLDKAKATATHDPGEKKPVIPTVCAVHNSDGTFTARFGYDNHNSAVVSIPIGSKNHVSPSPENRGQPTQFKRDEVGDAFQVNFTEDQKITWTLTGPDGKARSVTASDGTQRCAGSEPQPTSTKVSEDVPPTSTPLPTVTDSPTQPPHPSRTPTHSPDPTSRPPAPPTATNTPGASNPPTLPPPTPVTTVTPALIPVTGTDETHSQPGQPVPLGFVEVGIALLGMGAALHGVQLKIEER